MIHVNLINNLFKAIYDINSLWSKVTANKVINKGYMKTVHITGGYDMMLMMETRESCIQTEYMTEWRVYVCSVNSRDYKGIHILSVMSVQCIWCTGSAYFQNWVSFLLCKQTANVGTGVEKRY